MQIEVSKLDAIFQGIEGAWRSGMEAAAKELNLTDYYTFRSALEGAIELRKHIWKAMTEPEVISEPSPEVVVEKKKRGRKKKDS
jgi:hypothetical protein